ncbi:GNAT family N-acetyltransferase [Flavobacterium sp. H122]|uniref:GNAT family N-acetyltransferase n=1 Tax=Flavobacterium sp. H122 TaxID=2529860 RepID=UPI0020BF7E99|nr:GNAT family N-acetyltransferase [Flavobacterium sp. H122]
MKIINESFIIRTVRPEEYAKLGEILVEVYSNLEGFFTIDKQPAYYEMLKNVGDLTQKPTIELFGAFSLENELLGGVVFIGDMQYYGSGGIATKEKNSCGFRLLGISDVARGLGLGKALTLKCIVRTKELKADQLIIHTTNAMKPAWKMYEDIGFKRSDDLDFIHGDLEIFGFRYTL